MFMNRIVLPTCCVWLVAAAAVVAEPSPDRLDNWHQWRGPEANGTAPHGDPPVTWDDKTNVKWKAPLLGRGSATPIVWGDQVFLVTAVPTERTADAADLPKPDPRF